MLCSVSLFQMSHGATKWLRICLNASWHKFRAYLITHRNSMCVSLCKSTLSGWALWKSQKWPECLRQEHKAWCLHVSSHEHPCDRLHVFCGLTMVRDCIVQRQRRNFLSWTVDGFFKQVEVWEAFQGTLNDTGSHLELILKGATYRDNQWCRDPPWGQQ